MEKLFVFLGRTIYSIPFLGFGVGHLMNADGMKGMVPTLFPGGSFWIYFTGIAMILAALAIITGKQGRSACFGLALMLLVFIATVHLPGLSDPQMQKMALAGILKDTGLLGGALVIASTFKSKA
jgi:putative oxidoreductase